MSPPPTARAVPPRPKLFRDPVHDIIAFDLDDPVQATLFALVNTPEVQRLRRIRQLGMSALVYHGAEHSRFSHSMGVCHLAQRVFAHLFPGGGDPLDRLVVAAAALLHDVGHGAFSHVMERITGAHHEGFSVAAIENEEGAVWPLLAAFDSSAPARVCATLRGAAPGPLPALVSSQLDADRMDYILRDGMATGVKIGTFDLARIVSMLGVQGERLVVHERALEAVEGYLLARFHMYKQVYLHKATRSAERMLAATFERLAHLHRGGFAFTWRPSLPALDRLARGAPLTLAEHLDVDDFAVWYALERWSHEGDPVLARLAGGLVHRRLYKTVDVAHDDPRGVDGVIADAREAVRAAGGDPDYDVLVDSSLDSPYTPYQPGLRSEPITLVGRRGVARPIEQVSPIVAMLGEHTHATTRLCFPEPLRALLGRVAGPEGAPRLLP